MSSDSAHFVGDIPTIYDGNLGPYIFDAYAADLAARVAAVSPQRVLEIAAGTGILTRKLRDVLPSGALLTATDLNQPMLDVARAKFAPHERVAFETADAMALPFKDDAFDMAVCQFGVMFFPDKRQAFREARRVLAPGSRYLFSVWDSRAANPFARIAHAVVSGFYPSDPPQFYAVPFSYCDGSEIRSALADAGLICEAVNVVKRQQRVDAPTFARGLVYGNPLIAEIRARGAVDPDAIVQAMTQALLLEFGAEPMSLQAIVVVAQKE